MEAHFAGKRIPLPKSKFLRIGLGIVLLIGWCFSWLPVLGFWLLPMALIVLSIDFPFLAPLRNKVIAWCSQASHWLGTRWAWFKKSDS